MPEGILPNSIRRTVSGRINACMQPSLHTMERMHLLFPYGPEGSSFVSVFDTLRGLDHRYTANLGLIFQSKRIPRTKGAPVSTIDPSVVFDKEYF